MKKLLVRLIAASATALAHDVSHAAPACQAITAAPSPSGILGQLIPWDCTAVWLALKASAQFPDVFQSDKTLPGFCFISPGTMQVNIGGKPFAFATLSAWTSEFMPQFPSFAPLGQDKLGTVVTQVTVYNASNLVAGSFFTRDSIDLSGIALGGYTASEQDVVVGGTGLFKNAKGAYRIDTALDASGAVNVTNVIGSLCDNTR